MGLKLRDFLIGALLGIVVFIRIPENVKKLPGNVLSLTGGRFPSPINSSNFSTNNNDIIQATIRPFPTLLPIRLRKISLTPAVSLTPSVSPISLLTPTAAPSLTPFFKPFPTFMLRPTITPSNNPVFSITPSPSPGPTSSLTPTVSITPTLTPNLTPSPSVTFSPTPSPTVTLTVTPTSTITITFTPTPTPTPSLTLTPTPKERLLIAYWKVEEGEGQTMNDNSGKGYNLSLIPNPVLPVWSTKAPNLSFADNFSVSFDGLNYGKLATASANPVFDFNDGFTAMAWINADPGVLQSADASLLSKWFNNQGWKIGFTGSKIFNVINGSKLLSGPDLNDGLWHHIAVSWNGFSQITYIDGNKTGFIDNSQIPLSSDKTFYLANFKGNIDEVKIYNYARTQTEIASDSGVLVTPTPSSSITPSPVSSSPTSVPVCGNNQCCKFDWCGAGSTGGGGIFCLNNERCAFDESGWLCVFDSKCG